MGSVAAGEKRQRASRDLGAQAAPSASRRANSSKSAANMPGSGPVRPLSQGLGHAAGNGAQPSDAGQSKHMLEAKRKEAERLKQELADARAQVASKGGWSRRLNDGGQANSIMLPLSRLPAAPAEAEAGAKAFFDAENRLVCRKRTRLFSKLVDTRHSARLSRKSNTTPAVCIVQVRPCAQI